MAVDSNPAIHPANSYVASSAALTETTTIGDIARISGSATKTVAVTSVYISGTASTSASQLVTLIKRSAANSGGTAATVTAVPLDSNSVAATCVVNTYTGTAPTPGAAVGNVADCYIQLGSATVPAISQTITFPVPITLRGVAQGLTVNLNSASITGGSFSVVINYYEY